MVGIKDFSIGRLQRTRHRHRRELMACLLIKEDPAVVAPTLLRFVRVRADIRNATLRVQSAVKQTFVARVRLFSVLASGEIADKQRGKNI